MSISTITLTDIQDFIVRQVKNSDEFAALSESLLNSSLSFYRGSDLSKAVEETPYFIGYKFNSQDIENQDSSWVVQYVIAIDGDSDPVIDGDEITLYEDSDHVEQLAVKALDIIREGLSAGDLGGVCTIRVVDTNILVTEIGEADDVQAIVTLRLQDYKIL